MHEARLPQTSREMLWRHQWLLPTSGSRPWLERPPLPHWVVIGAMKLFGHDDRVWIVRLPSALMGAITVLLTIFIASRWLGREVGIAAGCLLATSYKFYQYATLAEDDIYLAMLLALAAALFTQAEFSTDTRRFRWFSFFTNRPWPIWFFFAVLGISNLTKGPLLGILILGAPAGAFLCLQAVTQRSLQPLLRYTWLWGWILLIALTIAWPLWAYHRVPDVLENWKYDYLGRMSGDYSAINQPWWYYAPQLVVALLPWTPLLAVGLWIGFRRGATQHWFVLCWALVPLMVLSIPKGKHDHYLVPFLSPCAILEASGLAATARHFRLGRKSLTIALLILGLGYCAGESLLAARTDHTVDDTAFLIRCRDEVPKGKMLCINAKLGPAGNLDFFRMQFYSRPDAVLLHNLSFLRDDRLTAPIVYVLTRQRDAALLGQMGTVEVIDQSRKSHEIDSPAGRFTLFRLSFDPHLLRYPVPAKITSRQAMERASGPWCGPPME